MINLVSSPKKEVPRGQNVAKVKGEKKGRGKKGKRPKPWFSLFLSLYLGLHHQAGKERKGEPKPK